MNKIPFTFLLPLLLSSCIETYHLEPGVYHYYDEKEVNGLVSKSIRIKADKTFYLFGIRLNTAEPDSLNTINNRYLTYITYGDWSISGKYLILNANNEYLDHVTDFYQVEDSVFLKMRIANFITVVPDIKNDSLLITENKKVLEELSTKIKLRFQEKFDN